MKFPSIIIFICLSLIFCGNATAKVINQVAAVVNDEIITTYQVEQALKSLQATQSGQEQATMSDPVAEQVLDRLIEEKLLAQRIDRLDLQVSEQEVNAAIEDVKVSNNIDQAGLEAALAEQGMTLADYHEQIRNEILRYKLLAQEVRQQVAVTSNEVRQYFEENMDQYDIRTYLHVSRISFPLGEDPELTLERARQSRQRLLAGENFSAVVDDVSDHAEGDIMGELTLEDLASPLQTALRDLNSGDISEPIELNRQLHLFIVTDRTSGEELAFERVRDSIEENLKMEKTEQRFGEWEQQLRADAYIDKRL